jgi:hypothetical protein
MNRHHLNTKLVTSAVVATATVVAPALLIMDAGSAHAVPDGRYSPDLDMSITWAGNPLGLTAIIHDFANPKGQTEHCHYHSVGIGATPPIPFDADAFPNGPEPASLFIPVIQLGGRWNVTVTCDQGGSMSFDETY